MSLDVYLNMPEKDEDSECVYWSNITHNLALMAKACGLYDVCWHPGRFQATRADDLVARLEAGLKELKSKPDHYKQFNPENGWGEYDNLVAFAEDYLKACKDFPNAAIFVSI